jgi:hypothetical protein
MDNLLGIAEPSNNYKHSCQVLPFVFLLKLDLGKPTIPLENFNPLDTECPTQPTGSHGNVRDKGSPRLLK